VTGEECAFSLNPSFSPIRFSQRAENSDELKSNKGTGETGYDLAPWA